jgi:hypothetical protein
VEARRTAAGNEGDLPALRGRTCADCCELRAAEKQGGQSDSEWMLQKLRQPAAESSLENLRILREAAQGAGGYLLPLPARWGRTAFKTGGAVNLWQFIAQMLQQAAFPSLIFALHLGAVVEALLRGDPLRALYFTGGAVLTSAVILMGVRQ